MLKKNLGFVDSEILSEKVEYQKKNNYQDFDLQSVAKFSFYVID